MTLKDKLGKELVVGDTVTYPVATGSSAKGMAIARIIKIELKTKRVHRVENNHYVYDEYHNAVRDEVQYWHVRLETLMGALDNRWGHTYEHPRKGECVNIQKVDNLVKVDIPPDHAILSVDGS